MTATTAFALASLLHAGFQLTVTVLVYPALSHVREEDWVSAHARHSRAITPVVVLVYGLLVATGVALVVAGPDPAGWVGLGGAATALAVTAAGAAPLHGRLSAHDPALVVRLIRVDRWRCLAAVAGALAALAAVWTRA